MHKLQGQEQQQQMASRLYAQAHPVAHAHVRVGSAGLGLGWAVQRGLRQSGHGGQGRHWQRARLQGCELITCGVCTSINAARCNVFSTNPLLSTSLMVGFTGTPSTAAPTCMAGSSFGRWMLLKMNNEQPPTSLRSTEQIFTGCQTIDQHRDRVDAVARASASAMPGSGHDSKLPERTVVAWFFLAIQRVLPAADLPKPRRA